MVRVRLGLVIGAAAIVSLAAAHPHVPAKLDIALTTWAKHPPTPFVRTLIQVRPGTAAQVARQLARLSRPVVAMTTDSLVADLSPAGLSAANLDGNVVRLSGDAQPQVRVQESHGTRILSGGLDSAADSPARLLQPFQGT